MRADTLKFAKSYSDTRSVQIQNQNSLLVKRQTDNKNKGEWGLTGGDLSRALSLTREVNLDTQSSDNSTEEIRETKAKRPEHPVGLPHVEREFIYF